MSDVTIESLLEAVVVAQRRRDESREAESTGAEREGAMTTADLDAILSQLAEGHWLRPTAELGRAIVERIAGLEAERDQYHRYWSDVLAEHHDFMNNLLNALDLDIDEDGAYILDQIVAEARRVRTEAAAVTRKRDLPAAGEGGTG